MISEIAIWESYISGNRDAFADLYRIYHPRLYNYGFKFTQDTELIEDGIQETFLNIWIKNDKACKINNIQSYLFVAFRHVVVKRIKHQKKIISSLEAEQQYPFELTISVDQVMINKEMLYEQQINLRKAIEKLSARQKEALFLMFYENMPYQQVAEILNISTKATYKLMARAVAELKSSYQQQVALLLIVSPLVFLSSLLFY